jgi:hypothetical protein
VNSVITRVHSSSYPPGEPPVLLILSNPRPPRLPVLEVRVEDYPRLPRLPVLEVRVENYPRPPRLPVLEVRVEDWLKNLYRLKRKNLEKWGT